MRHLIILAALAVSAPAWGQRYLTCPDGSLSFTDATCAGKDVMLGGHPSPAATPSATPGELRAASAFNAEVPSHGPLCHPDTSCPGRPYTLDEIDRMRAAVTEIMNGPSDRQEAAFIKQNPHTMIIGNPWPRAKDTAIEDHLRTYMQAGVSPEALEAKAKGK